MREGEHGWMEMKTEREMSTGIKSGKNTGEQNVAVD